MAENISYIELDGKRYTVKDAVARQLAENSLPAPATGTIGYFLAVEAVDADGKITATKAVETVTADTTDLSNRVDELAQELADLKYVAIKITAIANSAGTAEMGSTVGALTIHWTLNKAPVNQTLEGTGVEVTEREYTFADLNLTTNRSFTLQVTDERNAVASANTSVTFLNGVYFGVMTDGATVNSAALLALDKTLQSGKSKSFTVTAGAGQRIAYALPSRYGTPTFNVGGFDGGFSKKGTIAFTNASGYTENYDVWLSDNTGLGNTTVKVT